MKKKTIKLPKKKIKFKKTTLDLEKILILSENNFNALNKKRKLLRHKISRSRKKKFSLKKNIKI